MATPRTTPPPQPTGRTRPDRILVVVALVCLSPMLGLVFFSDTIVGVHVRGLIAEHVTGNNPQDNPVVAFARNGEPEPSHLDYPWEAAGGNHNSGDGATGDGAVREATGQPEADGGNPVSGILFDPSGQQQADPDERGPIPPPPLGDEQLRISSESLFGESEAAAAAAVPEIHTPPAVGDKTDTGGEHLVDGSGSGEPDDVYDGSADPSTGEGYLPPDGPGAGTSSDDDTAGMWGAAGMALLMSVVWAVTVNRKRRRARAPVGPAAASDGAPPAASVLSVNDAVGRLISYLRKDEQLKREAERMYNEIMEERVAAWDANQAHIDVDNALHDIDDKDIDDAVNDDFEITVISGNDRHDTPEPVSGAVSYDTGDRYAPSGTPSDTPKGLLSRLFGGRTGDDIVDRYRKEHGLGGSSM